MRKIFKPSRLRVALALSLLAPAACDSGGQDGGEGAQRVLEQPSSPSPIRIVGFDELESALVDYRGDGMLLNFWAIWCGPCVAELPELVEVAHAYRERGGRVVGVSYDLMVAGGDPETIEATMRRFLDKRKLDIPVLVYDDDDYEALNSRYELPGEIPVTLAINASGQIVDRQHGKAGKERFDEMMRKALGM